MILLAGAALAWTLEGPWPAEERQRVARVAEVLPPDWVAEDLRVRLDPAAVDAEPRDGRVTLAPSHLEPGLVHALAHTVDRGWSASSEFRGLSGWGSWPLLGPPADRDPAGYGSPGGMRSPAEDLATLATAYFLDRERRCDMPAKWRWFAEQVGDPRPAPCTSLAEVGLDPSQVAEIDVVYVASAAKPASLAGHSLVLLRGYPEDGRLGDEVAYAMVADSGGVPSGSVEFITRGLVGGFVGVVVREPLASAAMRYTEEEDRDLRLYRFVLGAEEKARVLARLDELRTGWARPYLYITRNCTQLPIELARAAWGQGAVPETSPILPDAVIAALARAGRLGPVVDPRPSLRGVGARGVVAGRLRAELERRWRREQRSPALSRALRDARARRPDVRAGGLRELAAVLGARVPGDELGQYFAWTDAVERGRRVGQDRAGSPVTAALRELSAGIAPTVSSTGGRALRDALVKPPATGTMHTPLRPVTVRVIGEVVVGDVEGESVHPAVELELALYDSQLGAGRAFTLADTLSATVLRERVRLRVDDPAVRVDVLAWHSDYVPLTRGWVAPSVGLTLADVRGWLGAGDTGYEATFIEPSVGVRLGSPGASVSVRGAVSVGTPPAPDGGSSPVAGRGLGLVEVALQSPSAAMTGAWVSGRGGPAVDVLGRSWLMVAATAAAGVRLGEVAGADVGARVEAAARRDAGPGTGDEVEVGLALRVERF